MHLVICRMLNLTLTHGMTGAGAYGFSAFGLFLGPTFQRYAERYRFYQLACDGDSFHCSG